MGNEKNGKWAMGNGKIGGQWEMGWIGNAWDMGEWEWEEWEMRGLGNGENGKSEEWKS